MKRKFNASSSGFRGRTPSQSQIPGTRFAVDGFESAPIVGVDFYFLTHFHSDHYSGLTSRFNKPIYCSGITGRLCVKILRVNSRLINVLKCNETVKIAGIDVTAVDANHCPGSVMLMFGMSDGTRILHCGDFRANPGMETYDILRNKINTLYLDTTYCNVKFDFPSQESSVEIACDVILRKQQAIIDEGGDVSKLLIVTSAYLIGKEKFFLGIASTFNYDIWCSDSKRDILRIAIDRNFDTSPHKCQLHVLSMNDVNPKNLSGYLKSFGGRFNQCIGFKPSGWENNSKTIHQYDNIMICGVPYSEHSSYSEMKRFCQFCKPDKIISSIPGHDRNNNIQKHIRSWMKADDKKSQRKITDFFKTG